MLNFFCDYSIHVRCNSNVILKRISIRETIIQLLEISFKTDRFVYLLLSAVNPLIEYSQVISSPFANTITRNTA